MTLDAQQALVKGEQSLVDFEDVVVPVGNEILHDDVELAGMGEGKTCFPQHLPCLLQGEFQSHSKGHGGGLGWLVVDIRADFGEQFAVNVGLFVTLGVSHALLVDFPQQHLGKTLVQFAKGFVQTGGCRGAGGRHTLRFLHGHRGHSHPAALSLPAIGVGIHIAVIDVGGNVGTSRTPPPKTPARASAPAERPA